MFFRLFYYLCSLAIILNGINAAKSPLLLVSLDGMRADKFDEFVQANPSSNFRKIIDNGIKAEYMIPAFPSQTFPNHWTLVTGVYTEVHGIVGNQIYDPVANMIVDLQGGPNSNDPRWWNRSDPIWLTAKNKGLKTAVSFWPGSEVWTRAPDIFLHYTSSYNFKSRIDEMVNWYLKFNIDLGCLYFNEPDSTGHAFGPDSQQYKDKIKEMDGIIGYLLDALGQKNLLNNMNIIILSDHGMSKSQTRPLYVPDYVDRNLVDFNRSVFAYASNIYPKDMSQLEQTYKALQALPNTTIYYKKDVPVKFHYTNSDRIAPLVAITDEGYVLTSDPNYKGNVGLHGFDNSLLSMRAIFTAVGPAFKKNQTLQPFENVNVQPLMVKLLDLESFQSNGTAKIFEPYLASKAAHLSQIYVGFLAFFSLISTITYLFI